MSIYEKEYKTIISKLKNARKDVNLDQDEVAKQIGVTQSYVSKIESGQVKIDILMLKKLARIYNKNINYFLN